MTRRLVVIGLLLAACSDATGPEAVAGTYTLIEINGEALPATIFLEVDRIEVLSGRITLNADGTASNNYAFRLTTNGVVTTIETMDIAAYTLQSGAIRFTWASVPPQSGTVSGDRLTLLVGAQTRIFRR